MREGDREQLKKKLEEEWIVSPPLTWVVFIGNGEVGQQISLS